MYCKYCGQEIVDDAVVCIHCGRALDPRFCKNGENNAGLIVLLLCIFVGFLGVHRFYTGHIGTGIVQVFTFGGCGIWWLIDFLMIATGSFKDNDGRKVIL